MKTLSHWQKDSDLTGIRDRAVLEKLPPDEQKAFKQLWSDVAALSRAIRRIIENPTEAAGMGLAGRAKASSKFRWEILGPQVETIYEAAVRS